MDYHNINTRYFSLVVLGMVLNIYSLRRVNKPMLRDMLVSR